MNSESAAPVARRRGRRRRLLIGVFLLVLAAVVDLRKPPERQFGTRVALGAIEIYQGIGSERVAAVGVRCRFRPTCSHYGHSVIAAHGWWRGGWLTAGRLLRCGPWTAAGTADPPPPREPD